MFLDPQPDLSVPVTLTICPFPFPCDPVGSSALSALTTWGIKGWVVLSQPGRLWGSTWSRQQWNPGASRVRQLWSGAGSERETAMEPRDAKVGDRNATMGQRCGHGDRNGTVGTETVQWGEMGPQWQRRAQGIKDGTGPEATSCLSEMGSSIMWSPGSEMGQYQMGLATRNWPRCQWEAGP